MKINKLFTSFTILFLKEKGIVDIISFVKGFVNQTPQLVGFLSFKSTIKIMRRENVSDTR